MNTTDRVTSTTRPLHVLPGEVYPCDGDEWVVLRVVDDGVVVAPVSFDGRITKVHIDAVCAWSVAKFRLLHRTTSIDADLVVSAQRVLHALGGGDRRLPSSC